MGVVALPKLSTLALLVHIAGHEAVDNYGLAISKATGYPSGTVVPALNRMTDRDGWLARFDQPTATGRPRLVYAFTEKGTAVVAELVDLLSPRIAVLAQSDAAPSNDGTKVNISSLWLLSAALMSGGAIKGYSDLLRPLTHQAVYAEMARLVESAWFETDGGMHRLTPRGLAMAAALGQQWQPKLDAAHRKSQTPK